MSEAIQRFLEDHLPFLRTFVHRHFDHRDRVEESADYSYLSAEDLEGVDAETLALMAKSKQLSASREL